MTSMIASTTPRYFVIWDTNVGFVQWTGRASTPEDALRIFDKDVGIHDDFEGAIFKVTHDEGVYNPEIYDDDLDAIFGLRIEEIEGDQIKKWEDWEKNDGDGQGEGWPGARAEDEDKGA